MESRHNMLLKALTMHVSCLFFKPEAVSKHSVSLWIGYSVPMALKPDPSAVRLHFNMPSHVKLKNAVNCDVKQPRPSLT